jgi:hypothetical protein
MTRREEFALAFFDQINFSDELEQQDYEQIATICFALADAFLAVLAEEGSHD